MLSLLSVLEPEQVQDFLTKIDQLRLFWVKRKDNFYTLGTALYLDKIGGNLMYDKRIETSNFLLKTNFSPLYDQVLQVLQKELKEEVVFETRLALPGFHIFLASPEFVTQGGKIHFDLQFLQVNWNHYQHVDSLNPLSFTITLSLPDLGGGLFYWDKYYDSEFPLEPVEAIKNLPQHYLDYQVGKMVVHNGLLIHQIAPAKKYQEGERRITLQGHAMRCEGIWRVYW